MDLREEAVLVLAPDGSAAGYADVVDRARVSLSVYGCVHPDHRGRGIGAWLVGWGEGWMRDGLHLAPERARVTVRHYVVSTNKGARRLLETHGYEATRGTYVMEIDLEDEPPEPGWPDGLGVRTFAPGGDDRAVFEAVEDAFRDVWDRPRGTFERFVGMTENENFDPSLWFLAPDLDPGGERDVYFPVRLAAPLDGANRALLGVEAARSGGGQGTRGRVRAVPDRPAPAPTCHTKGRGRPRPSRFGPADRSGVAAAPAAALLAPAAAPASAATAAGAISENFATVLTSPVRLSYPTLRGVLCAPQTRPPLGTDERELI